jgi:DNA repair MmcB-like protein
MDGDAYRDMSHGDMQQLIWRKAASFADFAQVEYKLPNGCKADVYYTVQGTSVIVEVKTAIWDYLIEDAYNKYASYCHYLAIACPPQLCAQRVWEPVHGWTSQRLQMVGVWWCQWEGLTEIRPACRLDVETPGHVVHMAPAFSPFAVIGSPPCTARKP